MSEIDDFLDFAGSIEQRSVENGLVQGRQFGYERSFRQGFSRGLDYAMENHREIAKVTAFCLDALSWIDESDQRQKRLIAGVLDSCREFRDLIPDSMRYAELLASIRARYQHLTGANRIKIEKDTLTF